MIFLGQINNCNVKANILIYRGNYDPPDNKFLGRKIRRWALQCHFFDDTKSGVSIEGLDNSRGKGFRLFPNPYVALQEELCIKSAIGFLEKLGFRKDV